MDKKIVKLYQESRISELSAFISDINYEQIYGFLYERAMNGQGDVSSLISAMLAGFGSEASQIAEKKALVFKASIDVMLVSNISNRCTSDFVNCLLMESDGLTVDSLVELVGFYADIVKMGKGNSKCFELYAKFLSLLCTQSEVSHGARTMTGLEYKQYCISNLLTTKWPAACVIPMSSMMREVPLDNDEAEAVLRKLLAEMSNIQLQELPPLVYQMLLLAAKNHRKLVLDGILSFFGEKDKEDTDDDATGMTVVSDAKEQLQDVEGTVIVHISFMAKQDPELGKEFIKLIKTNCHEYLSSPFAVAVCLAVAKTHRLQDQVFEILKSNIVKSFREHEKRQKSQWMRDVKNYAVDLKKTFGRIIENSKCGWDQVVQGLIQLAFLLMDGSGAKAGAADKKQHREWRKPQTPLELTCDLGREILSNAFKALSMVRNEVFEQILNRLLSSTNQNIVANLALLTQCVRTAPQTLLESMTKVQLVLDYVPLMAQSVVTGLLLAMMPAMRISMSLKDCVLVALRKALFTKHAEARQVAVSGFLTILKHCKMIGGLPMSQLSQSSMVIALSQPQGDSHIQFSAAANEALCLEIIGSMRRCLQQQAAVRLALYDGVYDVVRQNPELGESVLSLLVSHLQKYYENRDDVTPALKLQLCVVQQEDKVYSTEPLAHLLRAVVACTLRLQQMARVEDTVESRALDDAVAAVAQLAERMAQCELEDYGLDKTCDMSTSSEKGMHNNISVIIVSGVLEVLMEFCYSSSHKGEPDYCLMKKLYGVYDKLHSVARSASQASNGETKKGKSVSKAYTMPTTLASFTFLRQLLHSLFSDRSLSAHEGLSRLRETSGFVEHVLSRLVQLLQQAADNGRPDCPGTTNRDELHHEVQQAAGLLLNLVVSANSQHLNHASQLQCLEGCSLAFKFATLYFKDSMESFLSGIDIPGASSDSAECVTALVKTLQRLAIDAVSADADERNSKVLIVLLEIIDRFVNLMSPETAEQVYEWARRICTESDIDDMSSVKALFKLMIGCNRQFKSCVSLMKDISRDIHIALGDIEQDVQIQADSTLKIVVENSANAIMVVMLTQVETELEDNEWMIDYMSSCLSSSANIDTDRILSSICIRLGNLVNMFHELVQTAIPSGTATDALVRVLTKLYTTFTALTKHVIDMCQGKTGQIPNKFEKLVKLSGVNLTQYIYPMINYLQQSSDDAKKPKKAKGKAAKPVLKETRMFPNLVFAVEQYERFLIKLSKKSKIGLMEHFKMSTSRDFRINAAALQAALEHQSDSDNDNDDASTITQQSNADNAREQAVVNKENIQISASGSSSIAEVKPNKKRFVSPALTGNALKKLKH